jgi:excinuclease ABC subunit A
VVVEHNMQLMKAADWLIDVGPGAADEGGRIVVTGTPEDVAECAESKTGRVLERELKR